MQRNFVNKEPDSTDKPGGLSSSIPEIYFDIIGRVVPGAVAIGLYQFEPLTRTLNAPTIGFGLVGSYFLGVLLDIFSNRIWELCFYSVQPALARRWNYFRLYRDGILWPWIRSTPTQPDRSIFTKMMAEKMMLYSTSLVPLVATFFPPAILRHCYSGPAWHLTVPAFLLLAYCVLHKHKMISWDKYNYDERLKNNSAVA